MFRMLDYILKFIALLIFSYGTWLVFGNPVIGLFNDAYRVNKITRSFRIKQKKKSENPLISHLSLLLSVVLKREVTYEAYVFLPATAMIFILSFLLIIRLESFFTSLLFSFLFALIPYLILRAILRNIRIEGSYDGVMLVTGLINNYKQNYCNMLEAIDRTAESENLSHFSRNNILRLSMRLKGFRNEDELIEAVKAFVYAYQTEWSILLGMNIKIAVKDGIDVSTSLDDILVELKNVGESIEANKRYNNESFSMIRFLLIPLYLFTVYLSTSIFGFTLEKYMRYQFATELGLKSAIIMFSSIIACFVILFLAQKPKYDI
jgi:hypothetical protein